MSEAFGGRPGKRMSGLGEKVCSSSFLLQIGIKVVEGETRRYAKVVPKNPQACGLKWRLSPSRDASLNEWELNEGVIKGRGGAGRQCRE